MIQEDEFRERDAQGLKPDMDETPTETAELKKYMTMLLLLMPVIGQVFAWGTYVVFSQMLDQHARYEKRFAVIREYELGYVYLSVWVLVIARAVLVANANGARAPARVERPDQHAYKMMDRTGSSDAPFVLMATTGPQGRFNRAQRAVFNTDELLPLLLAQVVLVGAVFGPIVLGLVLLIACGRITFGFKYKEDLKARVAGFLPSVIGEQWLTGLCLLCAIKGLFAI